MILTIDYIARNPHLFHYQITNSQNQKLMLRPLEQKDQTNLLALFKTLSEQTKIFYSYTQPLEEIAKEMCDAINKYDKVRFVLEKEKEIIGLFELSMDIPPSDLARFEKYKITLKSTDCRFGPLLGDLYQSHGLATLVFPYIIQIAKDFGRDRIILWGGVRQNNHRAIKFYEKNGFKNVGSFDDEQQIPRYDMILKL